ncbi:MAG: ADP-ribosylglycohydrolase family protein [Spirochaetaceae bacterium]|nr:ADP-ribosylglycohydrolase family protein [Spirochaetaceae bacterium]
MLGAMVGDVIGSTREFRPVKYKAFRLFEAGSSFTDDSVMTLAVAKAAMAGGDYGAAMRELGVRYPNSGYGGRFWRWLTGYVAGPYCSYGNGSAMRVSPVAWAFDTEAEVLREAAASALPTHDHPEGVKGAQATALAIFMARRGADKDDIGKEIAGRFGYDLSRRLDDIRPGYRFDETCQGTVPEAIISFLESSDFEDAVRNAVSLGGDADTLAAIAGSIAEAHYGDIPGALLGPALATLDEELSDITFAFLDRFRPEAAGPAREALSAFGGRVDPSRILG